MTNTTIVPFVKWVGGKRQIINELKKRMPKSFDTYYEPFIGGGALLFDLQHPKAVINDLNKELINTYRTIKSSPKRLQEYLLLMEYGHTDIFYKKISNVDRNEHNEDRLLSLKNSNQLKAARFIYLNKAGFNGMYRVNRSGHFNIPTGKKAKVKTHDYENILNISKYFKANDIKIMNKKFDKVALLAQEGDFVYLDPPYDYDPGTKGFDAYSKEGFGTNGQKRLAMVCRILDGKGVKFMVSNHNTKLVRELYDWANIDVINAKRLIGGKGASRKDVEEVVITNYEKR